MAKSKASFEKNNTKTSIDFDQWVELAKTDPQGFEAKRTEWIEATIDTIAPHKQHRMRCLQWKIDQIRDRAASPMDACIQISEMMWDSLTGSGGLKDALEHLGNGQPTAMPKARVLKFEASR